MKHRCSNNQEIKGINKSVKESRTFRKRLPLGTFVEVVLRMCHEFRNSRHQKRKFDASSEIVTLASVVAPLKV